MPSGHIPRALALSVLALTVPAGAGAATVSVKETPQPAGFTALATVTYVAPAGEVNNVRFDVAAEGVTVTDAGADLTAGTGCTLLDARHAVCTTATKVVADWTSDVTLGDGDDRAVFAPVGEYSGGQVIANGGVGDDVIDGSAVSRSGFLRGEDGRDTITGTGGDDSINGGAGSDTLSGLAGNDSFTPDPPGDVVEDDVIDGGKGTDGVRYEARTLAVNVDLRRVTPQGSAGENDSLQGIEDAQGTSGDDVLLGNERDNDLISEGGKDRIEGFDGDDRVWGKGGGSDRLKAGNGRDIVIAEGGGLGDAGAGPDTVDGAGAELIGGEGDDEISATGGSVTCGGGNDALTLNELTGPFIKEGCEYLNAGGRGVTFHLPLRRMSGGIRVVLGCDEEDGQIPVCKSRFVIKRGGRVVAKARYNVGDTGRLRLLVRYRPGGKRLLGKGPKRVQVSLGGYRFELLV
jgi:hypothetical protein